MQFVMWFSWKGNVIPLKSRFPHPDTAGGKKDKKRETGQFSAQCRKVIHLKNNLSARSIDHRRRIGGREKKIPAVHGTFCLPPLLASLTPQINRTHTHIFTPKSSRSELGKHTQGGKIAAPALYRINRWTEECDRCAATSPPPIGILFPLFPFPYKFPPECLGLRGNFFILLYILTRMLYMRNI